jgi:hypothetical protein
MFMLAHYKIYLNIYINVYVLHHFYTYIIIKVFSKINAY